MTVPRRPPHASGITPSQSCHEQALPLLARHHVSSWVALLLQCLPVPQCVLDTRRAQLHSASTGMRTLHMWYIPHTHHAHTYTHTHARALAHCYTELRDRRIYTVCLPIATASARPPAAHSMSVVLCISSADSALLPGCCCRCIGRQGSMYCSTRPPQLTFGTPLHVLAACQRVRAALQVPVVPQPRGNHALPMAAITDGMEPGVS